jgi:hypothetical protein
MLQVRHVTSVTSRRARRRGQKHLHDAARPAATPPCRQRQRRRLRMTVCDARRLRPDASHPPDTCERSYRYRRPILALWASDEARITSWRRTLEIWIVVASWRTCPGRAGPGREVQIGRTPAAGFNPAASARQAGGSTVVLAAENLRKPANAKRALAGGSGGIFHAQLERMHVIMLAALPSEAAGGRMGRRAVTAGQAAGHDDDRQTVASMRRTRSISRCMRRLHGRPSGRARVTAGRGRRS